MKKITLYKSIIIGGTIIGLGFGAAGCSFNNNNPVSIGKRAIEDMDAGNFKALANLYQPSDRGLISKNAKMQAMFASSSASMAKHGKIVSIKVTHKVINDTNATVNYSVKFSDGHDSNDSMYFLKINGKWYLSVNSPHP